MKALVVDDTLVCLNLTGEVLAKEGWDSELVHITDANRESFRIEDLDGKIPVSISDIDLVVSDLELGGEQQAWGFILAIRKQYPDVPVVLLTNTKIDFELLDELEKAGIFVRKQINQYVAPALWSELSASAKLNNVYNVWNKFKPISKLEELKELCRTVKDIIGGRASY